MNGHTKIKAKALKINKKEAYRLFWIVKGHLNASEQCILDCYDSYFKRVWYNEESYIHEQGFEEAWSSLAKDNK